MNYDKKYSPRFLAWAFFFFLFSFFGKAQELKLNFIFPSSQKIYFSEVIGTEYFPIDSMILEKGNSAKFNIKNKPIGYYKIHFNDTNIIDIIINNEPTIEITFHDSILQNGVEIISSAENMVLWNFKYYSRNIQQLQKQIIVQRSFLQESDSLYQEFSNKLETLEHLKKEYLTSLCTDNSESYFKKTVFAAYPPLPVKNQTAKQVHFINVDFSDPSLIRSTIFSGSMMEYLQKHTEYTEQGFQESIDYILALANQNQEVYEYCLNYLLELFNLVGPDIIFDYLVENYLLEGGCSEGNISEDFKNITESYRKLLPGNKAPEFSIKDTAGNEVNSSDLYGANSKFNMQNSTLLFFWSSQCGHCHEAIPELVKLKDNINIIAISLDTNKEDWLNYINENKLPFQHYSELKGWDGTVNKLFKIHKTPGFIVINELGMITKKPKSVHEITKQ